jgi:acyl carrier protein
VSTGDSQGNRISAEAVREAGYTVEVVDGVVHVDATVQRKRRLKASGPRLASSPDRAQGEDPGNSNGRPEPPKPSSEFALSATSVATPVAMGTVTRQADEQPTTVEPVVGESASLSPEELADFLVNFVVEQTGYPPEIVEMEADLEADLGIDSIKKAQLFGELREHFDIQPSADLSLDDFPTLAHVRDYLLASSQPSVASGGAKEPVARLSEVESSSPDSTSPDNTSPDSTSRDLDEAPTSSSILETREVSSLVDGRPVSPSITAREEGDLNREELERFLVNFVVEQTGYPEDIVELDADLEADLGIDSIKKAQLFGELREHFDVTPSETLSLDDFPTLGHVRDYLLAAVG